MELSRPAPDDGRSVSTVVVEAVADALGVRPLEIEPPLYRTIDPDALDALFAPRSASDSAAARISFTYAGCEVTVRGRGEVVVESTPESDFEQPA